MASDKSLSATNLEKLGAKRLAALLIDITAGDAGAKRRLRLELASNAGGAEVAHEVRKRIATIGRSRSFLDWDKVKPLATDLATQHRAIIDHVAPSDPRAALELLWQFMALATPVMSRCDDSNGHLMGTFETALPDLGVLARAARTDQNALAERAFDALSDDDHGQYAGLIAILAEPLGEVGLNRLKGLLTTPSKRPPAPNEEERRVIGWGMNGPIYADAFEARHRARMIGSALQQIADLQGDVDGFIASHSEEARRVPATAAEIALRLLAAGRTEEAWQAIESADTARRHWAMLEWETARAAILEALGRSDDAQAFRWACFERSLEASHLRAYLKKLPDFENFEAESRALTHVLGFSDVHHALVFLLAWPALDRANRLVLERHDTLNGDLYYHLAPAADALEPRYPLAATLLRRAMIDFALNKARYKRYPHAAKHLAECASLSARIDDFGPHPTHEHYVAGLRAAHGRKTGFWQN